MGVEGAACGFRRRLVSFDVTGTPVCHEAFAEFVGERRLRPFCDFSRFICDDGLKGRPIRRLRVQRDGYVLDLVVFFVLPVVKGVGRSDQGPCFVRSFDRGLFLGSDRSCRAVFDPGSRTVCAH